MADPGRGEAVNGPVEIRVHGIGNHDLWSALGSPRIVRQGSKRRPTLALPPVDVLHSVVLVNWSRMSRSAPGILWYVAFPFTLMNVVFAMQPQDGWRRRLHILTAYVVSVTMTVLVLCWGITFLEYLVRVIDLPDAWVEARSWLPVVGGGCATGVVMLTRARRDESRTHVTSAVLHALLTVAVCAAALIVRPGQWRVNEDSWLWWFAKSGPTDADYAFLRSGNFRPGRDVVDFVPWFDPLGAISYAALMLCVLAAVAFLISSAGARSVGPHVASASAVLIAGLLLSLLASSAVLGLTRLLSGLQGSSWIPTFGERDAYDPRDSLFSGRFGRSYPSELLTGVAMLGLALFVVAFLVVGRPPRPSWRFWRPRREATFRWAHGMLDARLPRVLLVTNLLWLGALAALAWGVAELLVVHDELTETSFTYGIPEYSWPGWIRTISIVVSTISVAVFYTMRKVNSTGALREVLAKTGDVAGFWPITIHPLGARTYRHDAVEGIQQALALTEQSPVVLVGHSQGSVLAAWTVANGPGVAGASLSPLFLVTCGSPLRSLYAAFFPRAFDDDFFAHVTNSSRAWVNFWRDTDPIATPIQRPGMCDTDLSRPAGRHGGSVQGHSDYWVEAKQVAWVEWALAEANASAD